LPELFSKLNENGKLPTSIPVGLGGRRVVPAAH